MNQLTNGLVPMLSASDSYIYHMVQAAATDLSLYLSQIYLTMSLTFTSGISWSHFSHSGAKHEHGDNKHQGSGNFPLVQGWVHDQTQADWYRYSILGAYVVSAINGIIIAWISLIYLQWLASPDMFDW